MEEQYGPLFDLIRQMKTVPGKCAELIAILAKGTNEIPGCLSYVIAEDQAVAEHHAASLKLPAVQASLAARRPLIAGFDHYFKTTPVAGVNG